MCCTECCTKPEEKKQVVPKERKVKEKKLKVPKERSVPWWAEGLTFKEYQEVSRYSYLKVYRDENRPKIRETNSLRRARLRMATPRWLNDEHRKAILELFEEAKRLEELTGVPHEVDHIIPLKSPYVSGLHVPWNLQVLQRSDNRKKSSKLFC